ncbi:MAG: hypothetical protein A3F68_03035 [Acidobacteria bacterium RIFCSPLOWO2_12_FULL_54_10]|nr:MAG: hypothetical protein A3F68_03035 [Acidobacteria bacterium RIFCSPLOWO2_12_FULL_54_10]
MTKPKHLCLRKLVLMLVIVPGFLLTLSAWSQIQVAALEKEINDPDPVVRERAAREFGEQGNPAYVSVVGAAVQDQNEKVRMAVVKSLIRLGSPASVSPLCTAVRDGIPEIRYLAIDGLINYYIPGFVDTGFSGFFRSVGRKVEGLFSDVDTLVVNADVRLDDEVVSTLRSSMIGAPEMETRRRAARALGILRAHTTIEDLVQATFSNDIGLIEESLRALQKINDRSAGPRVIFLLNYPQSSVQRLAAYTVGVLQAEEAIPDLQRLLSNSSDKVVRAAALDALAFMPKPETAPLFQQYLSDKERPMRIAAALGIGRLKDSASMEMIQQAAAKERDRSVQLALAFALVSFGQTSYLQELVDDLGSRARRGEARPYLIELARERNVRDALYPQLHSQNADVRINLCQVFAASGDSTSISYLETLLRDRDAAVSAEASRAIRILRSRGM